MAAATMSGAWGHAVPLDEVDGNARLTMPRRDTGGSTDRSAGKLVTKRSNEWDLQSDSEQARQRRTSLRQTHSQAGRKRSRNTLKNEESDAPDVPRLDDSKWIHRDKLAQIEIKEMREAGIMLAPQRRSMSAGAARDRSRSQTRGHRASSQDYDDEYAAAYPYDGSPQRRMSPVFSDDEQPAPELSRYDYQDGSHIQSYSKTPARPGTSRIPIPRASPTPLSHNGESSLPRDRSHSRNLSGSWEDHQRKMRSYSEGSQAILDRTITPPGIANKNSSTDEGSPQKKRTQKKGPTSRKVSATPSISARPGSRAGLAASNSTSRRPSTGTMLAPEGEAPWIASMYKPDPRLPPDQQMLPTHAKRMMQEQWEREGKTGTAYDRELRLLNDDDPQKAKPPVFNPDRREDLPSRGNNRSPPKLSLTPNLSQSNSWTGGPLSPTKSEAGSTRPPTSGGYRITPTITSTPQRTATMNSNTPDLLNKPVPRLPVVDEKNEAKQKKGCCCVVM